MFTKYLVGVFISTFYFVIWVEGNSVNDFVAPVPVLQQLCPRGLRISISDTSDISFVGYHISVNKPLYGATPSEYSSDVGRSTNGHWQYDIPDLNLQKGDTVYYWMHIVYKGSSYLSTDHSWVIPGTPCSGMNSTNMHCQPSRTLLSNGQVCSGQLIFEEDFNTLNFNIWKHEITASGGKDNEFQMFVNNRRNSFVENGILHIRPTLTEDDYGPDFIYNGILDMRSSKIGERCTDSFNNGCYKKAVGAQIVNPVTSAHIHTSSSFMFQYGILKVRAKLPQGDWLSPGINLLPLHSAYGSWPKSGQILLVESRGNKDLSFDGKQIGVQRVEAGLLYGINTKNITVIKTPKFAQPNNGWDEVFHDYEMEWTPGHILFKIDNKEIIKIVAPEGGLLGSFGGPSEDIYQYGTKIAPFDQFFYISLQLAVGGTSNFFPDTSNNNPYPKPWNNTSPSATLDFWERRQQWFSSWKKGMTDLQVDYIRIWALP